MATVPLRVGFVGCGGISRLYTDIYLGLHELAQVVAVADLVPELARDRAEGLTHGYRAEAARQHAIATGARSEAERDDALAKAESAEDAASNSIQRFSSHTELLAGADVDAIVLLTAPSVRGGPTVEAAAQGVHVFTQGPMARSVEEADAMLEAAEAAGIKLHVQVGSRYSRGMRHAQRAVASGLMGQIAMANVSLNNFRPQSPYFRSTHWHGTWDGEGGTSVFHHGRYVIDPFLFVVGSPIVEVTSYAGAMLRHIETDDMTLSLVKFANGARGVVQSSLLYHSNPLTPINKIEVVGSEASMVLHQEYTQPSLPSVMLGSRGKRVGVHREVWVQPRLVAGSAAGGARSRGLGRTCARYRDVPEPDLAGVDPGRFGHASAAPRSSSPRRVHACGVQVAGNRHKRHPAAIEG